MIRGYLLFTLDVYIWVPVQFHLILTSICILSQNSQLNAQEYVLIHESALQKENNSPAFLADFTERLVVVKICKNTTVRDLGAIAFILLTRRQFF